MPVAVLSSDYERAAQLIIGPTEEIRNKIAQAIADERERCAAIVVRARVGDIDQDLRSLISRIRSGKPANDD